MDSRCEILIEKIYQELEDELSSRGISLEAVDDYFFEYEKEELENILEDIALNYLNRKNIWEKRIIEENLGSEETCEAENLKDKLESLNGNKISKETKTTFKDPNYNEEGYDKDGYDVLGWSKSDYHKTTKTKYNRNGYDREGYNALNWSKSGDHRITKTKFDENGYDDEGYSILGWSKSGYHKITKTKFNESNYNERGYDIHGWNGKNYNEKTNSLYNEEGYDRSGMKKTIWERLKSSFSLTKN